MISAKELSILFISLESQWLRARSRTVKQSSQNNGEHIVPLTRRQSLGCADEHLQSFGNGSTIRPHKVKLYAWAGWGCSGRIWGWDGCNRIALSHTNTRCLLHGWQSEAAIFTAGLVSFGVRRCFKAFLTASVGKIKHAHAKTCAKWTLCWLKVCKFDLSLCIILCHTT